MNLNIPESGDDIPDYLDEIMYNLKWMQTMQDPTDGGVYHKLTTPFFEGFEMPTECKQDRYVVQKSTQAALDFAATMALAARIYGQYGAYRRFAGQALAMAERAYAWAVKNPQTFYDQNGNNEKYEPDNKVISNRLSSLLRQFTRCQFGETSLDWASINGSIRRC